MSTVFVTSIECDVQGFPCDERFELKSGETVANGRKRARKAGWETGHRVRVGTSTRIAVRDYCPKHKDPLR